MDQDRPKKNRRSIRIPGYDYSLPGKYLVTLRLADREPLFGFYEQGELVLNRGGEMAERLWKEIPLHYPNVRLHDFVIMPDHIHGILEIVAEKEAAILQAPAKRHEYQKIIPRSLGSIIRGYKIGVTKWFRENTGIKDVWQRNFWERIIRNEEEFEAYSAYIRLNPSKYENKMKRGIEDLD